jgi:uncharacterized protein YicC (UPF0701 family)
VAQLGACSAAREGRDPAGRATQVARLADRCDITEELVWLGRHFTQFEPLSHLVISVEAVIERWDANGSRT